MKLGILLLFFGHGLLVSGCASGELNPNAQTVKLMKNDPPTECAEVGVVNSITPGFSTDNPIEHRNRLKNAAANMGANFVRMETVENTGKLTGTAFKCP